MRKFLLFMTMAVISAGLACSTQPESPNRTASVATPTPSVMEISAARPVEAARISLADAKKEYDAGSGVMIDVRTAEVFAMERIKGAINLPYETLDSNLDKLPKGKKLIVYCS